MSEILAVKQSIIESIKQAVVEAQKAGKLPEVPLPDVSIEHPQKAEHGDYATSLPLKLARSTGLNPLNIAKIIASSLDKGEEISDVSIAPPGFINFTLSPDWLAEQVDSILTKEQSYGNIDNGNGKKIQIEFVSANPTGPLHVGHGRGAVLGSALANVLDAAGFKVQKEYYVNDGGNQIISFYRSLYSRYRQSLGIDSEMPAEGYFGSYITELAKELTDEHGDKFLKMSPEEGESKLGKLGLDKMLAQIKDSLESLGFILIAGLVKAAFMKTGSMKR